MHEVDFRSPRDELTSDDYSSSDDDSQPSTSEYSPDRSHQQSAVPPAASERQGGSAHQHRPAVPMLGLKMPAQSQQEVQPPSLPAATRQHPPADTETNAASSSAPVPSLQLPRSFSRGTDNSRDASAPSRSMSRVQSQRKSSRHSPRPLYTIQLASDALTMDAATLQRPQFREMSSLEAVKHHCATELGIKQSAIRLYQLHEVTELTDSSLQLAIAVEGSEFTLASYEKMVQQNKEVNAASQQCSASMTELRELADKQTQDLSRLRYHSAELEADKKRLQDQHTKLQQDNAVLRDSLARATQAQLNGQTQVQQLKAEFDQMNAAFKQNVLGSEGVTARALRKGDSGIQAVHGEQPIPSLPSNYNLERLAAALERLTPQCLANLERLPDLLERLPGLSDQPALSPSSLRHVRATHRDQNEHRD